MEFELIQRNTTPSMIVEQILNSLESGKLKLGDKLPPERELSKMFGVSRSSVREAITALTIMGYLEVIQGKGTFLCNTLPASKQNISELEHVISEAAPLFDLMEARETLECQAARLAAERAEEKHIHKLEDAIHSMESSENDINAFFNADLDFHITLTEASSNVVIVEMMKLMLDKLHNNNTDFLATSYETKERTICTAKQILAFVVSGEGDKAAECMKSHLGLVDSKLKNVLLGKKIEVTDKK